ncbi:MAG: hypothetical protein GX622_09750 [Bacteroidales bacterium]|nr:hypothetical protein [Bacteroidales bacterium]
MKRIILGLLLCAAVSALSFGKVIIRGNSNTPFGTFTIEVSDKPVMIAGEELKCYLINYENYPLQVKVIVDKEKKCKNYVVVSDELSVMYTCNGKFMGVNMLDKKYSNAGLGTPTDKLDRGDYFHQKVITQGTPAEFDAMMLIASFYPELIK